MPKVQRVILAIAYSVAIIQFFSALKKRYIEVIEINYVIPAPGQIRKMKRETKRLMKIRPNNDTIQFHTAYFKKPKRLPTDFKYILKFTPSYFDEKRHMLNGQEAFIKQKCEYINCVFTNNMNMLIDIRNFDAILFDVENDWDVHPMLRSPDQLYIFTATEAADYYPICNEALDNYYNLTWTYKLDSDVMRTHFTINDKKGNKVGPNVKMNWVSPMNNVTKEVKQKLALKKKAVAWFVSNCKPKSSRMSVANKIIQELHKHGLEVDIYGECGNLSCPKENQKDCLEMVEWSYYFYFAFEKSNSEDYVTEKVLHAVNHYAVPVVYGKSNYERFLPPGSYIDAGQLNASAVAAKIADAMINKSVYYEYFRWHNHYTYKKEPEVSNLCTLCKLLNEIKGHRVAKNFRKWWNPEFTQQCERPITYDPVMKDLRVHAGPVRGLVEEMLTLK